MAWHDLFHFVWPLFAYFLFLKTFILTFQQKRKSENNHISFSWIWDCKFKKWFHDGKQIEIPRALAVNSFKYLHSTNHTWDWIEKDYSYWMAIEKTCERKSAQRRLRCQSSVEKGVSWSMPCFDRTWWKLSRRLDKLTKW